MFIHPINRVDTYKFSHPWIYPDDLEGVHAYIESRGGKYTYSVFFGLQALLREWQENPLTMKIVNRLEQRAIRHGLPFFRKGFVDIVNKFGGHFPVRVRAVAEGSVLPIKNVLVDIQETHPDFFWLPSYLETQLLRAVWYPTTGCTRSHMLKQVIKEGLIKSGNVANLPFKLHDFGARGVSSSESAQIGGAAHLVNFKGSDTWEAIEFINEYYMEDMAGYSIPASEHSTITAWGKDRELEAYANMLEMFPDKMFACVSDSYNIVNAVENLWGEKLKEKIKERTIPMVTRPDSGDPTDSPIDVIQRYAKKLGYSNNEKHFMIVNGMLVIQGDGNNEVVIPKTISKLIGLNYSLDNLSFGMGGELLQSFGRDDMQFAQKACAVKKHNSGWEGISKNPVGCDMKKSKHGIHETIIRDKKVISVPMEQVVASDERLLKTVYHNGELPNLQSFSEIRERSEDMSLVN